uniref:Disease resistance RPP13-like protein 4 n=1 Tax=Aegilops tauschii TaxID=37682 RepID=N1R5M4_AEGTA
MQQPDEDNQKANAALRAVHGVLLFENAILAWGIDFLGQFGLRLQFSIARIHRHRHDSARPSARAPRILHSNRPHLAPIDLPGCGHARINVALKLNPINIFINPLKMHFTNSRPRLPLSSLLVTNRLRGSGGGQSGHLVSSTGPYCRHFECVAEEPFARTTSHSCQFTSNVSHKSYWPINVQASSSDADKGKKPIVDSSLVGRGSQMYELHKYSAKARMSPSKVMSVWGIAGVGKSALVGDLYNDLRNKDDTKQPEEKQYKEYRWVNVSHPFNLRDFCRSILSDSHSGKDPIEECHQLLKQNRCLIVIDDINSKKDWELIKTSLLPRSSDSVIIVITTDASIATYCANNKELVFNVKGLEAAAAFDLFKQVRKRLEPDPSSSVDWSEAVEVKELILKCGGLPKVIVAIACALAKKTVTRMDTILSLNQRFMHHLETKPDYDGLGNLFAWMHSYFRTCPDSLKPCIFYSAIFPQDQIIRRRRLVRWWIAEGYSRDCDDISAEENGEQQFSELLDLSIMQQVPQLVTTTEFSDKRMAMCKVNGFIREYIIPLRKEENLVFELVGNCALTTQRTGRHLVIMEDWDRDRIVFESIDFSRLRSLTVFGKWESFFISESMKLLRVLDLEDASEVEYDDLKKMVKWLRRLKFLSLRGRQEIYHLPSSLDHLRQLQTLDVRGTSIVTLPRSITKLQKLQYIHTGIIVPVALAPPAQSSWFCRNCCTVGVEVPRGIEELTALHTLGVVDVGASGGKAILEELEKLTQLRKLGVSGINKHNSKKFLSVIKARQGQSRVTAINKHNSCMGLVGISLPLDNLQSLKLYGLENGLPVPLPSNQFTRLRKLALDMDTLMQNDIDFLANLPELCILRLRVKQQLQGGRLHFYAEMSGEQLVTFEKVKILEIACSSSELQVTFGSKSMKNLELFKIDYSSGTSYQLAGMNNLSELKQVLLMGTNDEEFRTRFASHLANHPNGLVVKLEELPRSS